MSEHPAPDRVVRVITLDVNDPAVVQVIDMALDRVAKMRRAKRADAVLADLRRYAEGLAMT